MASLDLILEVCLWQPVGWPGTFVVDPLPTIEEREAFIERFEKERSNATVEFSSEGCELTVKIVIKQQEEVE